MNLKEQVKTLLYADFPLIHIASKDFAYVSEQLEDIYEEVEAELGLKIFAYCNLEDPALMPIKGPKRKKSIFTSLSSFFEELIVYGPGLYITYNVGRYRVEDVLIHFYRRAKGNHIHLINIGADIPGTIASHFAVVSYTIPTRAEIEAYIKREYEDLAGEVWLVEELRGMTIAEIDNALALYMVTGDKQVLREAKVEELRKTSLVDVYTNLPTLEDVGGLDRLMEWLELVKFAYGNIDKVKGRTVLPKGCLLYGFPGTGKTLVAKAVAGELGLPLVHLDLGRLLHELVGRTESNTREILNLLTRLSPCVCLVDEVEKVISTARVSDNGVISRLIASLLFFMQESTAPVFFIFTSNDIRRIPAELIRAGRLDTVWFIDIPSERERQDIWDIKLRAAKIEPSKEVLKYLAQNSPSYTGAEIEKAVHLTILRALKDNKKVSSKAFINTLNNDITPVVKHIIARGDYEIIQELINEGILKVANSE